jgi:O-antigen/teichoic acid export membrane protein
MNFNLIADKILNLGIRGVSILFRFVLIFFISKYLTTEQLGDYSLFNTTVVIVYMILGWDFYTFANREIIGAPKNSKIIYVTNQLYFYVGLYVLIIPILILIYLYFGLPFTHVRYFFFILIFEHLGQEIFRLLVASRKPTLANISFFIRSALWVIVMLIFHYTDLIHISNLEFIYEYWLGGSVLNFLIFAFYFTYKLKLFNFREFNLSLIFKGFKIASYYFAATVAFKIVEFSNRYVLDWKASKYEVGIYTVYSQMASIINVVVFTFVIMFLYPILIEAFKEKDIRKFSKIKRSMFRQIVFVSGFLIIIIILLINPILDFIDKSSISQHKSILYVLLAANFFLNLSFVWHYQLFAFSKEKYILRSSLISAFIVLISSYLLISNFGLWGAPIALLIGYLALFILKYFYSQRTKFNEL